MKRKNDITTYPSEVAPSRKNRASLRELSWFEGRKNHANFSIRCLDPSGRLPYRNRNVPRYSVSSVRLCSFASFGMVDPSENEYIVRSEMSKSMVLLTVDVLCQFVGTWNLA